MGPLVEQLSRQEGHQDVVVHDKETQDQEEAQDQGDDGGADRDGCCDTEQFASGVRLPWTRYRVSRMSARTASLRRRGPECFASPPTLRGVSLRLVGAPPRFRVAPGRPAPARARSPPIQPIGFHGRIRRPPSVGMGGIGLAFFLVRGGVGAARRRRCPEPAVETVTLKMMDGRKTGAFTPEPSQKFLATLEGIRIE